jgi:hypothetical protein
VGLRTYYLARAQLIDDVLMTHSYKHDFDNRPIYKGRTRKGLAGALSGSGPKLVEDADALVLQETLTRFGLNSHHQRDLEVKRSEGPPG